MAASRELFSASIEGEAETHPTPRKHFPHLSQIRRKSRRRSAQSLLPVPLVLRRIVPSPASSSRSARKFFANCHQSANQPFLALVGKQNADATKKWTVAGHCPIDAGATRRSRVTVRSGIATPSYDDSHAFSWRTPEAIGLFRDPLRIRKDATCAAVS